MERTAEVASAAGPDERMDASSTAASVSACDFQWCGGGLGVTDVMYLLWTSVQPEVVCKQERVLLR